MDKREGERERCSCPHVTQSYAINMLPCSLGAQALFNGAWWLEHGRHLTGTLYCYAFIYFWALSCVSFSVFLRIYKDARFHDALPRRMGKQNVGVGCVGVCRGSEKRSGLQLLHEIIRRGTSWLT